MTEITTILIENALEAYVCRYVCALLNDINFVLYVLNKMLLLFLLIENINYTMQKIKCKLLSGWNSYYLSKPYLGFATVRILYPFEYFGKNLTFSRKPIEILFSYLCHNCSYRLYFFINFGPQFPNCGKFSQVVFRIPMGKFHKR